MATTLRPKDNAGVHGGIGYEFQKICALYLLLEGYSQLREREYFIYFEHYEDFVFCFTNGDVLESANLYQAKKSGEKWTLTTEFKKTIHSMCEDGVIAKADTTFNKTTEYQQYLHFVTNALIELKRTKTNVTKEINSFEELCDEAKSEICEHIKDDIKTKLCAAQTAIELPNKIQVKNWYESLNHDSKDTIDTEIESNSVLAEIPNLKFRYVDLGQKTASQKEQLKGKLATIFNDEIAHPSAAIETLLLLFSETATTLNQECVSFADVNKRVSSNRINNCFDILTSKSKAIEYWRSKGSEISRRLNLRIRDKQHFESAFSNSFDYFKDLTKAEHQKILTFTSDAYNESLANDIESFVGETYDKYIGLHSVRLSELEMKATIYAAYFENEKPYTNE
jgi:hypothetical protein